MNISVKEFLKCMPISCLLIFTRGQFDVRCTKLSRSAFISCPAVVDFENA